MDSGEIKDLYNFMINGSATLNLEVGDKVTLNDPHISQIRTVKSINGVLGDSLAVSIHMSPSTAPSGSKS